MQGAGVGPEQDFEALVLEWEENLTKKHFERMDRYSKLPIDLREGKHHGVKWTVVPLCVERSNQ